MDKKIIALSVFTLISTSSSIGTTFGAEEYNIDSNATNYGRGWHTTSYGTGRSATIADYCDSTGYTPFHADNTGNDYEYVWADPDVYGAKSDTDYNGHARVDSHMRKNASIRFDG